MVFYDQGSLRAGARHGAGAHGHQTSHTGFRLSPSGRSWSFPFSILYLSPATFRRCAGSFDETCSGAARKKQEWLGRVTQEVEVPPQGLLRDRGLSAPTGVTVRGCWARAQAPGALDQGWGPEDYETTMLPRPWGLSVALGHGQSKLWDG